MLIYKLTPTNRHPFVVHPCPQQVEGSSPYLMIVRAGKSNNVHFTSIAPGDGNLAKVHAYAGHAGSIFQCAASGNKVLLGGSQGSCSLYQLHPGGMERGEGLKPLSRFTVGVGDLNDLRISPPGTSIVSSRIGCLDFAPLAAGDFQGCAEKLLVTQVGCGACAGMQLSKQTNPSLNSCFFLCRALHLRHLRHPPPRREGNSISTTWRWPRS